MKWNRLIFKDRKLYLISVLFRVLSSFLTVFGVWCFYQAIGNLHDDSVNASLYYILGFFACEIIGLYIEFQNQKKFIKLIYVTQNNLRNAFMSKYSTFHPREFLNKSNEMILNNLETDSHYIAQYALVHVVVFGHLSLFFGYIILYGILSWTILLILLALTSIKLLLNLTVVVLKSKITIKSQSLQNDIYVKIGNYISNFSSFVFANKKELLAKLFIERIEKVYQKQAKYAAQGELVSFITQIINWASLLCSLVVGIVLLNNSYINLALFLIFIVKYQEFSSSASVVFSTIQDFKTIKEYNKKVNDFFATFRTKNTLDKVHFKKLTLEKISFAYEEKQIFNNFNLEIFKNQKHLIIGKSGSGKTTLTNILLNIISDYSGDLYLNDYKINNDDDLSLNISVLNKENVLPQIIPTSYWDNENIKDKLINLHIDFVDFEKELETSQLSLGQQQRLKILEVLSQDKEIYIFDEALSNLDKDKQNSIFEYLINLDKTIIFISHHFDQQMMWKIDKITNLT
ncbi:ABC transporter ATP-binding protein/permease [Mycoplasmopsis gallinacea]|uniref:ABC transporter ATP-binding protein n=1 Tax=Mycoplasmopsis gallinacea TaxID=29556 RepID=A0A449A2N7_9BACT|nr:ABC transporter ATP-binding protein/permease [Mycoplasmopsis gallinacea]VEU58515.1 ABC transporter ATP-binding protein [Mycoplasmopsis gallinacea]